MSIPTATSFALVVCILACTPTEPQSPYFRGIITSRQERLGVPAILVNSDTTVHSDPQCTLRKYFGITGSTRVYRLGGGGADTADLVVGRTVSAEMRGAQLDSCPPILSAGRIFLVP